MVDPERLNKVGEQLRDSVPADIQEAKEVITQKESVVNQAYLEARRIKEAAEQEAEATVAAARQEQESRIDQTEVMKAAEAKAEETNQNALQEGQEIVQDAQRRAYRIVDEAESGATTRREGSDQYARETLFELEERMSGLLSQVRRGIDALGLEVEVKIPAGATNGT